MLKCKYCKYYRGSCKLGLEPNDKCMWFKPSIKKYPVEKLA